MRNKYRPCLVTITIFRVGKKPSYTTEQFPVPALCTKVYTLRIQKKWQKEKEGDQFILSQSRKWGMEQCLHTVGFRVMCGARPARE